MSTILPDFYRPQFTLILYFQQMFSRHSSILKKEAFRESSPPGNTVVSRDAKMDSAIIGGVIAAMIFVVICFLVVLICYLYRHKGTYHTNEAKGTEFAENADVALKNDPNFQDSVDESKKEYFI
ncbi:glycophorin-C-like isoform X4 [Narcine bancroftii]|uniref:glycophorin-C-like isoform X4 n=1 Tax=Narcine bancroftii TaxID=1343680 RepID=UPI003831D61E